jgi:hypothetical protein
LERRALLGVAKLNQIEPSNARRSVCAEKYPRMDYCLSSFPFWSNNGNVKQAKARGRDVIAGRGKNHPNSIYA